VKPTNEEDAMKRLFALLAVCGALTGIGPLAASAAPPNPPPGCDVVVDTPAATTGSDQGQENKQATFDRLCS
jgi:hypothetical protein